MSSTLGKRAAGPISGYRVVKSAYDPFHPSPDYGQRVTYCDALTPGDVSLGIGITLNAAADGGRLLVLTEGEIVEPSWTWTPGAPIFVGPAGSLVSAVGVGFAWSRVVGVAETSNIIFVRFLEPIVLAP